MKWFSCDKPQGVITRAHGGGGKGARFGKGGRRSFVTQDAIHDEKHHAMTNSYVLQAHPEGERKFQHNHHT